FHWAVRVTFLRCYNTPIRMAPDRCAACRSAVRVQHIPGAWSRIVPEPLVSEYDFTGPIAVLSAIPIPSVSKVESTFLVRRIRYFGVQLRRGYWAGHATALQSLDMGNWC